MRENTLFVTLKILLDASKSWYPNNLDLRTKFTLIWRLFISFVAREIFFPLNCGPRSIFLLNVALRSICPNSNLFWLSYIVSPVISGFSNTRYVVGTTRRSFFTLKFSPWRIFPLINFDPWVEFLFRPDIVLFQTQQNVLRGIYLLHFFSRSISSIVIYNLIKNVISKKISRSFLFDDTIFDVNCSCIKTRLSDRFTFWNLKLYFLTLNYSSICFILDGDKKYQFWGGGRGLSSFIDKLNIKMLHSFDSVAPKWMPQIHELLTQLTLSFSLTHTHFTYTHTHSLSVSHY